MALVVPIGLVLGSVALVSVWPCEGTDCAQPALGGWLLVLIAFPTALASGLPWYLNVVTVGVAVATSLGGWLVLGSIAARRAARDPLAGWRDYWAEYLVLAGSVAAGVLVGLVLIAVISGA